MTDNMIEKPDGSHEPGGSHKPTVSTKLYDVATKIADKLEDMYSDIIN